MNTKTNPATHITIAVIPGHPAKTVRRVVYSGSLKSCQRAARSLPSRKFEDWQGKLTLCDVTYEVEAI